MFVNFLSIQFLAAISKYVRIYYLAVKLVARDSALRYGKEAKFLHALYIFNFSDKNYEWLTIYHVAIFHDFQSANAIFRAFFHSM